MSVLSEYEKKQGRNVQRSAAVLQLEGSILSIYIISHCVKSIINDLIKDQYNPGQFNATYADVFVADVFDADADDLLMLLVLICCLC